MPSVSRLAEIGNLEERMKFSKQMLGLLLGLMTLMAGAAVAKEPPVAKLVDVDGEVAYSRNGEDWSPVNRTKYLFSGYHIRTGEDGTGKLVNQAEGTARSLFNNTVIHISEGEILVVAGRLSEPTEEDTSVFESLMNKFAKAQRYTTVRRSMTAPGESPCDNKVRTIREVTVSPSHSDLVWRNACPEYSYKLVIDNQREIEIPAHSTAEMIRYSVAEVGYGEHSYRVEVLDNDGTIYIPRRDSKFTVLNADQEEDIMEQLEAVGDDIFLETTVLEENGLHVAAMDAYREYFRQNPSDNDMRPLLIQSYQELKLSNLRESEARLYNANLEQDF